MCLRIPKMLGCGHSWTFDPVSNWVVNITIWYRYVECSRSVKPQKAWNYVYSLVIAY